MCRRGEKCPRRQYIKVGFVMNAQMNIGTVSDMDMKMNFTNEEKKEMGIAENCNVPVYSLMTVAGGILLAIGTVVYSLIAL